MALFGTLDLMLRLPNVVNKNIGCPVKSEPHINYLFLYITEDYFMQHFTIMWIIYIFIVNYSIFKNSSVETKNDITTLSFLLGCLILCRSAAQNFFGIHMEHVTFGIYLHKNSVCNLSYIKI